MLFCIIRLGLLLTLLLMTINLNNSAADKIPPSGKICPLVQWILLSIAFILFALFEYFLILVGLRFWGKVNSHKAFGFRGHIGRVTMLGLTQVGDQGNSSKVTDHKKGEKVNS